MPIPLPLRSLIPSFPLQSTYSSTERLAAALEEAEAGRGRLRTATAGDAAPSPPRPDHNASAPALLRPRSRSLR